MPTPQFRSWAGEATVRGEPVTRHDGTCWTVTEPFSLQQA